MLLATPTTEAGNFLPAPSLISQRQVRGQSFNNFKTTARNPNLTRNTPMFIPPKRLSWKVAGLEKRDVDEVMRNL